VQQLVLVLLGGQLLGLLLAPHSLEKEWTGQQQGQLEAQQQPGVVVRQ
jgi:hypothetical protein